MEKLSQLRARLSQARPASWDALPDIDLYMDQVMTYMSRQYVPFRKEEQLTSSMVNNYIKDGLLARANGKKYSREHMAYLTVISMLKQVLSVKDTGFLIRQAVQEGDAPSFYGMFLELLDAQLTQTAQALPEEYDAGLLTQTALRLAVASFAAKLACERLVDMLREDVKDMKEARDAKEPRDARA